MVKSLGDSLRRFSQLQGRNLKDACATAKSCIVLPSRAVLGYQKLNSYKPELGLPKLSNYQYKRIISDNLLQLVKSYPALVLTGPRQVGKTTLLKELFPTYNYVSLDGVLEASLAEESPEEFLHRYPPPVLIDEVQYAPKLFRHLKSAIDNHRHDHGRFILTGSQKFQLMAGVSESLAGRVAIVELETLMLSEILTEQPRLFDQQRLEEILIRGFFPELWRNMNMDPTEFYRSYVATYLERDLRQIIQVTSLRDFDRFMRSCATRSGSLLNKSDLAKDLGTSAKTIHSWLNALEASNQVMLLEPYFGNLQKRLIKTPKLYFADVGLLSFLLNASSEQLSQHPLIGGIWETFVYSEIRKYIKNHNMRAQLYFYRDQQSREVDFVIETGGYLHLIECKWKEIPQASDAKTLSLLQKEINLVKSIHLIGRSQQPGVWPGPIHVWGGQHISEMMEFIRSGGPHR
ncbi:MAG: ATP-binding protein [Oligoflexus sp.]